jgi:threonyl-tRNA synthetase
VDASGAEKQPIMLHRVLLGSIERFIGALIEHYAGSLPAWLSPVQVTVIPIKTTCAEYAELVKEKLENAGIRVKIDNRSDSLDKRIREAEVDKSPYVLVIGEREVKQKTVSVRKKGAGDLGAASLEDFIKTIRDEIDNKK